MIEDVKHIYAASPQEFTGAFAEWLYTTRRNLRDPLRMKVVVHSIGHHRNDHYIHYEIVKEE